MSKLNILVVGNHLNYSVEYYTMQALQELGVNARFLGYRDFFNNSLFNITRMAMTRWPSFRTTVAYALFLKRFNELLIDTINRDSWDLVLMIKGEMVLPSTLKEMSSRNIKRALWFIDDPRFFDSLVRHIAPHYDFVFTSSTESGMLERYKRISGNVMSLPFGCDSNLHRRLDGQEKKFDICFVGTCTPFRKQLVKKLRQNGVNIAVFGSYWKWFLRDGPVFNGVYGPKMVEVFNQSKLCLNIHDPDSAMHTANMRDFEVTGSGGVLLTDLAYGLDKLLEPEKEMLVYRDVESLVNKIKQHVNSESDLQDIGRRAEERAHRDHTYKNRMETLLHNTGLVQH